MLRGFGNLLSKVGAYARRIPSTIWNNIKGLGNIGRNIVSGLWNGIKSKWDSMVNWLKEKARNLPGPVRKVLGIESPSRVFAKIGSYVGEGFALGIESTERQVKSAMTTLVSIPQANGLAFAGAMSDEYNYNTTAQYEVVVPLYVNSREFARATASDMQAVINQKENNRSRKLGYR